MHLIELYKKKGFVFSIEIFPPKTEKGMDKLKATLEKFNGYAPDYFSVTYGAGGTSRANTHEMAAHINNELGVPAMAHLTCVSHTAKEIDDVLTKLKIQPQKSRDVFFGRTKSACGCARLGVGTL